MTACIPPVESRLMETARKKGLTTIRERLEQMSPQCGYGELGTCCKVCYLGPCRIDPFGNGPTEGICGATADTIAARNLLREIVGGTSSHVGHARDLLVTLYEVARGNNQEYVIANSRKLNDLAERFGIATAAKSDATIAEELAQKGMADFGNLLGGVANWLKYRAPAKELAMWEDLGIAYSNPHLELEKSMHRTSGGNDADPVNLLLAALRTALVDGYTGLTMGTDIQDILFGTPQPVQTEANFAVLAEHCVNIAMHGHNPLLSEKIVEWAEKLNEKATLAGADRINVVGICCTGNELAMRHGVPMAADFNQAELLMHTGAVDEMIVDIQCIPPYLAKVAACHGTAFVTTEEQVKIPGAIHLHFDHRRPDESARKLVLKAIESFGNRQGKAVDIPAEKKTALVGFSVESLVGALSKSDAQNPLQPLIDHIVNGNILGIVGFVGCPNMKLRDNQMTERMVKELLKNNVLVVSTGCMAHVLAQGDFLTSRATEQHCGDGLKAVLKALGYSAGFNRSLPPVLHMGSCVDNSRIGDLVAALASSWDVKIAQLPIAGSAPELMQEKAITIGTWLLALGLTVHTAPAPHVLGSPTVTRLLTSDLTGITGGKAYVEYDPVKAAQGLISVLKEKRKALGI